MFESIFFALSIMLSGLFFWNASVAIGDRKNLRWQDVILPSLCWGIFYYLRNFS